MEEMREYQEDLLDYSAQVENLLLQPEPKKPHWRTFKGSSKTLLRTAAKSRELSYEGNEKDIRARLREWDRPRYEERKKTWKQAKKDSEKMRAWIARFEFF